MRRYLVVVCGARAMCQAEASLNLGSLFASSIQVGKVT